MWHELYTGRNQRHSGKSENISEWGEKRGAEFRYPRKSLKGGMSGIVVWFDKEKERSGGWTPLHYSKGYRKGRLRKKRLTVKGEIFTGATQGEREKAVSVM